MIQRLSSAEEPWRRGWRFQDSLLLSALPMRAAQGTVASIRFPRGTHHQRLSAVCRDRDSEMEESEPKNNESKLSSQHLPSSAQLCVSNSVWRVMGSACSRETAETMVAPRRSLSTEARDLTDEERQLIKALWNDFVAAGKVTGGVYFFVDLLRTHPDEGLHFGLPLDMKTAEITHAAFKHNKKVRKFVGKVFTQIGETVENLDNLDSMAEALTHLGSVHSLYGINADILQDGWPYLRYALTMHLGVPLSPSAETAWHLLYSKMIEYMVNGMEDAGDKYLTWEGGKTVDNENLEELS